MSSTIPPERLSLTDLKETPYSIAIVGEATAEWIAKGALESLKAAYKEAFHPTLESWYAATMDALRRGEPLPPYADKFLPASALGGAKPHAAVLRRAREYDDDDEYLRTLMQLTSAVWKKWHQTRPTQKRVAQEADIQGHAGFSRASIRRFLGRRFPGPEREPWAAYIPYWREHKDGH